MRCYPEDGLDVVVLSNSERGATEPIDEIHRLVRAASRTSGNPGGRPRSAQSGEPGLTTTTGQALCAINDWLVEPSTTPRNAPRPRVPTTTS